MKKRRNDDTNEMKHANKAEYINEILIQKQTNMFELETDTNEKLVRFLQNVKNCRSKMKIYWDGLKVHIREFER